MMWLQKKINNFVVVKDMPFGTVVWTQTGYKYVRFRYKIPSGCPENAKQTLEDAFLLHAVGQKQ